MKSLAEQMRNHDREQMSRMAHTVTRVATGSAQIIINTEDGNFVAVHTVTVT